MIKCLLKGPVGLIIGFCVLLVFVRQYRFVSQQYQKIEISVQNSAANFFSVDAPSEKIHEEKSVLRLDFELSHPLENSCKYPILHPDDKNIDGYVRHPRKLMCPKVQPEFSHIDKNGYLYIQEDATLPDQAKNPNCFYRVFDGSLKPRITTIDWLSANLTLLEPKKNGPKFWIPQDQFEVQCFPAKDKKRKKYNYRYAHAHIGDRQNLSISKASEDRLSLNIQVLDSISLNQFQRHMVKSWPYMRDTMGFEWFEGYNKVADNSMVNLLPILAGLRYVNQSDDMPSDILPRTYNNEQIELESINFIWNEMKKKGCVTMLNDAIGHHTRGLFHYPWKSVKGFVKKPTDYYFRPWYVSNYRWPVNESSGSLCFGNHPLHQLHSWLMEQFINRYSAKCHFSFNFLTALSHNDPNHIEMMDNDLKGLLERLHTGNLLNNSALVILGDHGNRVSAIRYSYIGRFEERLPFLGIYLPDWFKRKHPNLWRNLRINRHRLVSNFDLHQTLVDIARGRFDGVTRDSNEGRGRSLFEEIPAKRSCKEAEIPEQYCTCLKKQRDLVYFDSELHRDIKKRLKEYFEFVAKSAGEHCLNLVKGKEDKGISVEIVKSVRLTQSEMVRQGIKYQNEEELKELKKLKASALIKMEIEYVEVTAKILPLELEVQARFQSEVKHPERFRLNVEPIILKGNEMCRNAKSFTDYCRLCHQ